MSGRSAALAKNNQQKHEEITCEYSKKDGRRENAIGKVGSTHSVRFERVTTCSDLLLEIATRGVMMIAASSPRENQLEWGGQNGPASEGKLSTRHSRELYIKEISLSMTIGDDVRCPPPSPLSGLF